MSDISQPGNKWYVLTLSTLTIGLGFALPTMCMPVLFNEIAGELDLDLVQVGVVWGVIALAGLTACLIGGALGDRFGLKRTVMTACFLTGLAGAGRGLAGGFFSLSVTSFVFGFLSSIVMINIPKISRLWFAGPKFGLANGIQATGMSLGMTLGAMISATVLSPWLGGWRQVLFLYGLVTILLGLAWLFTMKDPVISRPAGSGEGLSMRRSINYVAGVRKVWLLGLALSGYTGCLQGVTGYLPLYLRNSGWAASSADGTLAALNAAGAFGAIPVMLVSDRIGRRKLLLSVLVAAALLGTLLLSFCQNEIIWVLAIVIGFTRDASMTLFIVMTMEIEEIEIAYIGTALGFLQTLSRIGAVASPPLGNSLADIDAGTPFFFWAILAIIGLVILSFVRDAGQKIPDPSLA